MDRPTQGPADEQTEEPAGDESGGQECALEGRHRGSELEARNYGPPNQGGSSRAPRAMTQASTTGDGAKRNGAERGGEIRAVAVSLDVTGTLIHSPRLSDLYSEVLLRHGTDIPAERLRVLIPTVWQELSCRVESDRDRFGQHPDGERGWWNDYLQRICDYEEVPHPGPFAAAELYERFARRDAWEVYEDARPALATLEERGFRMVLTSNWDLRLPKLLERLDLRRHFEGLVFSAEVGYEKPHRAVFETTLAALELAASEVVHVGDRQLDDVEGAEAVGIRGLLLDRRRGAGDLSDLRELPERLARPSLST